MMSSGSADERLEALLNRINSLTSERAELARQSRRTVSTAAAAPGQSETSRTKDTVRSQGAGGPSAAAPSGRPVPAGGPAKASPAAPAAPTAAERSPSGPRVSSMGGVSPTTLAPIIAPSCSFLPREPETVHATGLSESEIESLALKYLQSRGDATGRQVAEQIRLPFALVDAMMRGLKSDRLVVYRDAAQMGDYVYELTELGRERARRYLRDCTYYGSAPVPLADYVLSVQAQSLTHLRPTESQLKDAFKDLLINQQMFRRLGPAINSGRGMFLFGYPGNGKTSIAERITRCFGQHIWIPRAIGVDGEIIRLYDPNHHEEVGHERGEGLLSNAGIDQRWIKIKRPTIVVGGELTMEQLEIQVNRNTGINEGPVQLKSNCGTLVIDDFGRQKMRTDELLNRWIVPLEKRHDYLSLPSGKSIQVPFDQLVVFSTNLEPKDLVDDAFLRRIPYKIEVPNPSEDEFRKLFEILAPLMGFEFDAHSVGYLIDTHYKPINRPFRCCQPRDLLLQVRNYCLYMKEPLSLSPDKFDFAVDNYFSVM